MTNEITPERIAELPSDLQKFIDSLLTKLGDSFNTDGDKLVGRVRGLLDEIERLRSESDSALQSLAGMAIRDAEACDSRTRELEDENERLRAVFEVVGNAMIQSEIAANESLPCKAATWIEGAKKALVDFAPSGGLFSEMASKIRASTWRDEMLQEANAKIEKLRALLPKAFDAGWGEGHFTEQRGYHEDYLRDQKRDEWVANALKEIDLSSASQQPQQPSSPPPAGSP